MKSQHQRESRRNVVIFPLQHCAIDFEQLTESIVADCLGLQSVTDIEIVRKSCSFARIHCRNWQARRYILSWVVRKAALQHFDVRIQEDLLRYERKQKQCMWNIMQALFSAYFYPKWNRSSVAWRYNGHWYEVSYGELPQDSSSDDIILYCNVKCGYTDAAISVHPELVGCEQQSPVSVSESLLQCVAEKSTQTQFTGESKCSILQNTVTSLQQDVSSAKMKTAKKTVECCSLRRKLRAKNTSICTETQTLSVDTTPCVEVAAQTELALDNKGAAVGLDLQLTTFETAVGTLEIPSCMQTTARSIDKYYQAEVGNLHATVLKLREQMHTEVEFPVVDQSVAIPKAFLPMAEQLDALYTAALSNALERVRANAAAEAEEEVQNELDAAHQKWLVCEQELDALRLKYGTQQQEFKEYMQLVSVKVERQTADIAEVRSANEKLQGQISELESARNLVQQLERKLHISKSVIDSLQAQVLDLRQ